MKFLLLIKSLAAIYLLLCVALFFLQESLIFHPPAELPHQFKSLEMLNQGIEIESIAIRSDAEDAILYFGGNAENVVYTATEFATHFKNHSTYLLKYRGYSGAAGEPEEQALYSDALVVFDEVVKKHKGKITVIGRSLGSAVATFLATKRSIDRLVLITPFDSIAHVAKDLLPILPIDWLLTQRFDSKSRAHLIQARTMVIVAEHDEVIPKSRTDALITALPEKNLEIVSISAGHNDIDLHKGYIDALTLFLEKAEASKLK